MEKASVNGACDTWLATFRRFFDYDHTTQKNQWVREAVA